MLLGHKDDIHGQNDRGEVALHLAACAYEAHSQINILQLLLDRGADVNTRDNEGSTPLHHSSFRRADGAIPFPIKGSVDGTRLLPENGAT